MISAISDVHIKEKGDAPYELFIRFLNHESVRNSEKIILLGDIFDFLVGGDQEFAKGYSEIFDKIQEFLDAGKTVYYLEGNHDFHLKKFFKKLYPTGNFIFSQQKLLLEDDGKKIMICHGDDIELDNPSYKIYSFFIRSFIMKYLVEWILPFSISKMIGERVSARSRKKNLTVYESKVDNIREKFRRSAEEVFNNNFSIILAGHSHVKDEYKSELGFTYLNNGYLPSEKTFLTITKEEYEFVSLTDSSL